MTKDEALRLALEALEESLYATTAKSQFLAFEALTAIKEALAQPAQEPCNHAPEYVDGFCASYTFCKNCNNEWSNRIHAEWLVQNSPAAQPPEPRNFCPRCGKRTADLTVIHTCTPPEGGHQ